MKANIRETEREIFSNAFLGLFIKVHSSFLVIRNELNLFGLFIL